MTSENYMMNSEISSDQEGDQDDESGGGTGSRRSYNCTFCKRGFTNAQALGGHMNIHRKDRAKTKQQLINMPTSTSSSNYRFAINDEPVPFPFLFHEPAPNPIIRNQNQPSAAPAHAFPYDPRSTNQELSGPNLSLQIGPTHQVDNTHHIRHEENEVDLELRLGYDK